MDKQQTRPMKGTLAESRPLRFLMVFLLYVAQGGPVGVFFFAIPAWLAANGASAGEIGAVLSATSLPWTLKFVNGFLMDRFTYLPMGRRRVWLIGAQTIMVALLIALAMSGLTADDIAALSTFSFLIMAATTFQDVAVDGMAVDLVPDDERARANGLMFGGQAIGIALGSAFTGFAITAIGLSAAVFAMAGFVATMLTLLIIIRERPGERMLPWTSGQTSPFSVDLKIQAWKPLIIQVWQSMLHRDSLLLTAVLLFQGCLYGFYLGLMPVIAVNEAGWSDAEFSGLSGAASLVAGLLGIGIFGFIADRFGTRQTALYGMLAMTGLLGVFWIFQSAWADANLIRAAAFIFLSLYTCIQISNCASAMKGCSLKVAATQFTLFMAIANLGMTLATAAFGPLQTIGGHNAVLTAMIIVGLCCAGAIYLINEARRSDRLRQDQPATPITPAQPIN